MKFFKLIFLPVFLTAFGSLVYGEEPLNDESNLSCEGLLSFSEEKMHEALDYIGEGLKARIIGQRRFLEQLQIAVITSRGHILVEAVPGSGKTRALKTLAGLTTGSFERIQFRGDMSASDITTRYQRDSRGNLVELPGKIMNNFILADEFNRGSEKAKSGLLEPMEEGQVSLLSGTHSLPESFLVVAAQNPLGDEGTMPISAAQLDRFLMNPVLEYTSLEDDLLIMKMYNQEERDRLTGKGGSPTQRIPIGLLLAASASRAQVEVPPAIAKYIALISRFTREGSEGMLAIPAGIRQGAGNRGQTNLQAVAQARAWLHRRNVIEVEDVDAYAVDVLRHRVFLTPASKATKGMTEVQVIEAAMKAAKEEAF